MKSLSTAELHSKIRNIKIEYDELVIGSTLEALTYCYLNSVPFICSHLNLPYHFENFDIQDDLTVFGLKNNTRLIKTNLTEFKAGSSKLQLWEKLFFYLSISGLCPLSDKAISLRISDGILKVSTPNARMAKINFNKLTIFDDKNFFGLNPPATNNKKCIVYDWFNIRSGMKHQYDELVDTSDFVNRIIFYPSDRVEGNHNFKDAVAVSHLTKTMLDSYEWSDINARFKTLYMMKEAGIRGARNGRDMNNKAKYKYYAVKIENTHREVIHPKNIYKPFDNITFNYDSFCDIIDKNPLKESYVSKLIN